MQLPFVSVIVPAYNAENTIRECIESLLNVDYPEDRREIIFVNNNSRDQTAVILDEFRGRIRVLSEHHQGPGPARNRGLHEARGTIAAFTDADGTVHPGWLRHLTDAMDGRRETVIGGRILAKPPANWIERFGEKIHDHEKAINVFKPPYIASGNYCASLAFLKQLGFFDARFKRGEDSDLSYRMVAAGAQFIYAADAIVYHQNERTLAGLFREGMQHGFWSVLVRREHRYIYANTSRLKRSLNFYRLLLASLIDSVRGVDRRNSCCYFIFNSGKAVGRWAGSIRFRYLDL